MLGLKGPYKKKLGVSQGCIILFLKTNLLLTLCADMEQYPWAGFSWENGWPVSPPERQEQMETRQTESSDAVDTAVNTATPSTPLNTAVQVNPAQEIDRQSEDGDSIYTGTSYQLSESEDEDFDTNKVNLGNGYAQCKAAREAAMTRDVVDITCNADALSSKKMKGLRVGSMEKSLDKDIELCFKGVRIEKNGNLVNQYLSSSFDPATQRCITCASEHGIWEGGEGAICFVLSDQNFVPTLPGCEGKKCLNIVRVENSSLTELAEMFIEIMDKKPIPAGTCILISCVSFLLCCYGGEDVMFHHHLPGK